MLTLKIICKRWIEIESCSFSHAEQDSLDLEPHVKSMQPRRKDAFSQSQRNTFTNWSRMVATKELSQSYIMEQCEVTEMN